MAGLAAGRQVVKIFIHCFVERDVFLFTAIDLSSCIASLETKGNLETSTSCVGSGHAVVWFSFVSVIIMHLSMLSPRVGAGYPREFDIMKLSQGRDFDT